MITYEECIPCIRRQIRQAVEMAVADEDVRKELINRLDEAVKDIDMSQSPPVTGQFIHRAIRDVTGDPDPYREIKKRFNRLALGLLPELKKRVENSRNPLEAATRLAIAGNMIDSGAKSGLREDEIPFVIAASLKGKLTGNIEAFADAVEEAEEILYLADNAGEIVFDRLLIERLPMEKVTLAVRGAPVLNDAIMQDAEFAGLTDIVEVIDNGSDAPGTILEDCGENFRKAFESADLVIAKGQGNYETLSDVDKNIFYLLKVKCPVIARDIGHNVGSMVIQPSVFSSKSCERKDNAGV